MNLKALLFLCCRIESAQLKPDMYALPIQGTHSEEVI